MNDDLLLAKMKTEGLSNNALKIICCYSKNGHNHYRLTKVLVIEEITRVPFLKFSLLMFLTVSYIL